MREFEKHQSKRSMLTIGYISNVDAYKAGEKAGWKAALEWVLGEHGPLDERVNNCACVRDRIRKELQK